jgi:hypothetical protein
MVDCAVTKLRSALAQPIAWQEVRGPDPSIALRASIGRPSDPNARAPTGQRRCLMAPGRARSRQGPRRPGMRRSAASRAATDRHSNSKARKDTAVSRRLPRVSDQPARQVSAPGPGMTLSPAIRRRRRGRVVARRSKATRPRSDGTQWFSENVEGLGHHGKPPSGMLQFADKYLAAATQSFGNATRLLYPLTGIVVLTALLMCGIAVAVAILISIVMIVEDRAGVSPSSATYLVLVLSALGLTGRIWVKSRDRSGGAARSVRRKR